MWGRWIFFSSHLDANRGANVDSCNAKTITGRCIRRVVSAWTMYIILLRKHGARPTDSRALETHDHASPPTPRHGRFIPGGGRGGGFGLPTGTVSTWRRTRRALGTCSTHRSRRTLRLAFQYVSLYYNSGASVPTRPHLSPYPRPGKRHVRATEAARSTCARRRYATAGNTESTAAGGTLQKARGSTRSPTPPTPPQTITTNAERQKRRPLSLT